MNTSMEHKKGEKGQSLVEFALSLTVLLVLLAGVVDLGRALFTYLAIRDAAQEGALYGSTNPTRNADIQARVLGSSNMLAHYADEDGIPPRIDVTIGGAPCSGNSITVQVAIEDFKVTMPFLGALLGSQSFPIRARVTDTILSPSCH